MFLYFVLLRDDGSLEALAGSQLQVGLIYITAYMMIMPLSQARFSDRYRAAWLFRAHPLASTGHGGCS